MLLIAAGDDQLAPSERLSRIAYERLQRNDRPYEDELVVYPGAGHIIQAPYVPAPPAYGGDPKSNQRANEDLVAQRAGPARRCPQKGLKQLFCLLSYISKKLTAVFSALIDVRFTLFHQKPDRAHTS